MIKNYKELEMQNNFLIEILELYYDTFETKKDFVKEIKRVWSDSDYDDYLLKYDIIEDREDLLEYYKIYDEEYYDYLIEEDSKDFYYEED